MFRWSALARYRHLYRHLVGIVVCSLAAGCSTLPNGQRWGEEATLQPGWDRVRSSASAAARDPWVWAPLLGAAVFQIDDWDGRTALWARSHTPLFGSTSSAEAWSDDLRDASALAHYITIAATPGGDASAEWIVAKAKGTLVGIAAVSSTTFVTRRLKTGLDRERPNRLGGESFPSGHTSSSAVHTRLASRNLRVIDMNRTARLASEVSLTALMIGTSWARIEAGWHYPSDVLFSMALGHFAAAFVNDAFLGLDGDTALGITTAGEGVQLQWAWRF